MASDSSHHVGVEGQVHVRNAGNQAVVGAVQRGGRGGKHDVVAVGVPASECRVAALASVLRQLLQPLAAQAHLAPVLQMAERPSQVPWCGEPMVMTWCTRASAAFARSQARAASPPMLWQISTGGRPVAGSRAGRRLRSSARSPRWSRNGLQVDGDEGWPRRAQPIQPRIPEPAVADEAVDKDNAAPATAHPASSSSGTAASERVGASKTRVAP